MSLVRPEQPYVAPRALKTDEIAGVVESYRKGAENAKTAGFDGVEIHGANGCLLDQFLQDSTNKRTDRYGGPVENRARLMLEVTDAVVAVWGAGRVGPESPEADEVKPKPGPLQVFGRRRRRHFPDAQRAGVQKAPGREVAGSWAASAMGI